MNSKERAAVRRLRREAKRLEKKEKLRAKYDDYDRALSINSLSKSADLCARGVRFKPSVQNFLLNKVKRVNMLKTSLDNGEDVHKGFTCFHVMERGKLRDIMSTRFSERVVQKSINRQVLLPLLEHSMVYDNAASRKGKGTLFALKRLTKHLKRFYNKHGRDGYILLVDIKNYFGSISHDISKEIIRSIIKDERIINLTFRLIDSYYEHDVQTAIKNGEDPNLVERKGLGLGSEINQSIALAYLSPLDHYIQEFLHIKYYGRYNDDFYLIHHSKEYLKLCYKAIGDFCERLKLTLNTKKTHIAKIIRPFTFLKTKFLITDTGKIVKDPARISVTRERRRLKKQKKLFDAGLCTLEDISFSYNSWLGLMKRKNSGRSVYNMNKLFNKLFNFCA